MSKEKRQRPGVRALYIEVPAVLGEQLDNLALTNRRTLKAEVLIALERHLEGQGIKPATLSDTPAAASTLPLTGAAPSPRKDASMLAATPSTPPADELQDQATATKRGKATSAEPKKHGRRGK